MSLRKIGLSLALLLLLASCGFSATKEAVAEVMRQYFTAIEARDYPTAMAFYAETFFKGTSRDAWEARLHQYTRQLGDLETFEAVQWNVKKNVGSNGGTVVQVIYQTGHSRHPAVEKFILKKTAAGFRIIVHRIAAPNAPKGKTESI